MRPAPTTVLTLLFASTLAAPAAANLLANPGFDKGIEGWSKNPLSTLTMDWAPQDEMGVESSGSLRIANLPLASSSVVFSECLAAEPGDVLAFGAAFRAGDGAGRAEAALWPYSDASCFSRLDTVGPDYPYYAPSSTWGGGQGSLVVPDGVASVRLVFSIRGWPPAASAIYVDNAFVVVGRACEETGSALCLAEGRFRVSAEWRKPTGERGWARVQSLTEESGYLWFFQPENVEVVAKVHDACAFNQRFWVFAAGLTNVEVQLAVTDTLTGVTWSHTNPVGDAFWPVQDTSAFATCAP